MQESPAFPSLGKAGGRAWLIRFTVITQRPIREPHIFQKKSKTKKL